MHFRRSRPHSATTLQHLRRASPHVAPTIQHLRRASPHFATTVQHFRRSRPHTATTLQHLGRACPHFAASVHCTALQAFPTAFCDDSTALEACQPAFLQRRCNTLWILVLILALVPVLVQVLVLGLEYFSWVDFAREECRSAGGPERGRGALCLFPLEKVACSLLERGRSQELSEHYPTSSTEQRAQFTLSSFSVLERGAREGRCLLFPGRGVPSGENRMLCLGARKISGA